MGYINAYKEDYQPVTLFDKPALFSNSRIERASIPAGLFAYDIRHSDNDDRVAATVERFVFANHMGTVITSEGLELGGKGHVSLNDERGDLNFYSDYEHTNIDEYIEFLSKPQQTQAVEPEQELEPEPEMAMSM